MSRKLNQKGFAVVETVLIIVIVALIGGTGFYVWHSNQQTKATLDAASKSANSSPGKITNKSSTSAETQASLTIKEWGVKGNVTSGTSLMYALSSGGASASFTSKELNAADAECAKTADGGGIIQRYTAEQQIVYENGSTDGTTAAQFAKKVDAGQATLPYKQVDTHYYFYIQSQGLCGSDSQTVQQLQGATTNAVKSFLKSLQAV